MFRSYWIAGIALGLTLAFTGAAPGYQESEQGESPRTGQEGEPHSQASPNMPDPVAPTPEANILDAPSAAPSPSADRDHAEQDLRAQQDMAKWAFWMVLVSAAGVIVSTVAVILVFCTLREARRTTRAALRSTVITKRTLDHIKLASERELRAYICIESVKITKFEVDKPLEILITSKNVGATPAYDYCGWYSCIILPNACAKKYPFGQSYYPTSKYTLGPGLPSGFRFDETSPISDREYRTVSAGKCTIFVWGEELYIDIFGKERVTKFRWEMTGVNGKPTSMIASPEGNEST